MLPHAIDDVLSCFQPDQLVAAQNRQCQSLDANRIGNLVQMKFDASFLAIAQVGLGFKKHGVVPKLIV
jgi:hypothetical protein